MLRPLSSLGPRREESTARNFPDAPGVLLALVTQYGHWVGEETASPVTMVQDLAPNVLNTVKFFAMSLPDKRSSFSSAPRDNACRASRLQKRGEKRIPANRYGIRP